MVKKATPAVIKAKIPASILTLRDVAAHVAETHELPKARAQAYLADAIVLIAKNLKKGNKVRISGLGIFQVKKRAARKGRNPATGAPVKIKASKTVGFKVGKELKESL